MEAWLAKNVIKVVAGLIILVAIVGLLGFNSWRNAQNGKTVVRAGNAIGTANVNSGQGAVNTLQNNREKDEATDAKLQPIINNFNSYPAAKTAVDPAFLAAFDKSLCVYRSAANLLQCRTVQPVASETVEN